MKKIALLFAVLLAIGISGNAFALPNSGTYLTTINKNDPSNPNADLSQFEAMVADLLGVSSIDLEFYAKTDAPSFSVTEDNGNGSTLDLTYESDKKSGTWNAGAAVDFYSVKAGNQYALYWLDSSTSFGTWSTEDLLVGNGKIPRISHLSTWRIVGGGDTPTGNPVPEPSTIFLFGLGLIGVAALNRKCKK